MLQFFTKTVSFQREAMRTQVALYFLWSEICIVSLCLNKQSVQNRQVEKSPLPALKDCDQKEIIGFDCISL